MDFATMTAPGSTLYSAVVKDLAVAGPVLEGHGAISPVYVACDARTLGSWLGYMGWVQRTIGRGREVFGYSALET
jgi:hypothetical protein